MRRLAVVLVLTLSQFTAFPFLAMLAANTARQDAEAEARQTRPPNVTVVYKTDDRRAFETL